MVIYYCDACNSKIIDDQIGAQGAHKEGDKAWCAKCVAQGVVKVKRKPTTKNIKLAAIAGRTSAEGAKRPARSSRPTSSMDRGTKTVLYVVGVLFLAIPAILYALKGYAKAEPEPDTAAHQQKAAPVDEKVRESEAEAMYDKLPGPTAEKAQHTAALRVFLEKYGDTIIAARARRDLAAIQRGKMSPLSIAKAATVCSTEPMFDGKGPEEELVFKTWGEQTYDNIPFDVIDPGTDKIKNVIELFSLAGAVASKMPRNVTVECNSPALGLHFLSGVSGWGFPHTPKGTVCMKVVLHYSDGKSEEHKMINGVHFANYISDDSVPESKLAFRLREQQIRYLVIRPERYVPIDKIEFIKGEDISAPVIMAITVEK